MSNQIKSTIRKLKYEDYSEDRKKAMKEIEGEKETQTDLREDFARQCLNWFYYGEVEDKIRNQFFEDNIIIN